MKKIKINFDINHPAHVHFFKNSIWKLKEEGHEVLITASEKDVACKLLDSYQLEYKNLGSYGSSVFQKLMNVPVMDWKMVQAAKAFDLDVFVGLASVRAAHASAFLRKKCINFDDTENGVAELRLYLPFVSKVCTPNCYKKEIGKKQVRYAGYHELAYLHPNYYSPDPSILQMLRIERGEKFVIMRFVSWNAVHDVGHKGMSIESKRKAVGEFSKYAKVFITSEKPLPEDLKQYEIQIPHGRIHDALNYASLLYGESATMASESAVLGTPAIYIDDAGRGYTDEQEKEYGSVFNFTESESDQDGSIKKGVELLSQDNLKEQFRKKAERLINDKIDVTAWMVQLIKESV